MDAIKNFAKVTVSTGYDASATEIVLSSGHGTELPAPATDGEFNLVWWNSSDYPDPADDPNVEIVRVTARTTDTLTVTRNQEGSGASTKNTASKTYKMILALTKKVMDDLESVETITVKKTGGDYDNIADAVTAVNASAVDCIISVGVGTFDVADTMAFTNVKFLGLYGEGSSASILQSATGLVNKPMITISSAVPYTPFNFVNLDGTNLANWGDNATEKIIESSNSGGYVELLDCTTYGGYDAIDVSIGSAFWIFNSVIDGATNIGFHADNGAEGDIGFTDITNHGNYDALVKETTGSTYVTLSDIRLSNPLNPTNGTGIQVQDNANVVFYAGCEVKELDIGIEAMETSVVSIKGVSFFNIDSHTVKQLDTADVQVLDCRGDFTDLSVANPDTFYINSYCDACECQLIGNTTDDAVTINAIEIGQGSNNPRNKYEKAWLGISTLTGLIFNGYLKSIFGVKSPSEDAYSVSATGANSKSAFFTAISTAVNWVGWHFGREATTHDFVIQKIANATVTTFFRMSYTDGKITLGEELDMGTSKITNVVDPTADQDAATKKYTDKKGGVWGNLLKNSNFELNPGGFGGTPDDWINSNANPVQGGFPSMTKAELISILGIADGDVEGLWNLNEASGNAPDLSSNGYNLTDNNTVGSSNDGLMAKARDFEASNSEYFDIADASCPNLEISGSRTVFALVKPEVLGISHSIMTKRKLSTSSKYFQFTINSDNTINFNVSGLTVTEAKSVVTPEVDKWYFVVGIYDSSNTKLKIFVNGIKTENTASGTADDTDAAFVVGANKLGAGDTASDFFDGIIQNAGVLSVALTDEQVEALFQHTMAKRIKIRRATTNGYLQQLLPEKLIERLRGKKVSLVGKMYQDTASIGQLAIGETNSTTSATTGSWVDVGVTKTISANATEIEILAKVSTSDGNVWYKELALYEGENLIYTWYPSIDDVGMSFEKTSVTQTSSSSSTYADVAGSKLPVVFPKKANVLVNVHVGIQNNTNLNGIGVRLLRGDTVVAERLDYRFAVASNAQTFNLSYLEKDVPAGGHLYKLQLRSVDNSTTVYVIAVSKFTVTEV